MTKRVVIDPVTRIEGHLRIELETDGQVIKNAWSAATQYRGIEAIMAGRDPRDAWAFANRICGVCTSAHAVASLAAVENAIGSTPPRQAGLIRDMVTLSAAIQDHVIHFYHLHALDWVNVAAAATADPAAAVTFARAIGSAWKGNTLERMMAVRDTVKGILDSGQLSIFSGGYWDHPDYRLPAEANLMAVAHYLDALEFQRSMIRINAVFGGKNPHPNFLVGGMACSIDQDKSETVNQVQISEVEKWVAETLEFVSTCYVPDAMAIMGVYKDYFDIGASAPNYIAVGLMGAAYAGDPNQAPKYPSPTMEGFRPGVVLDDDVSVVHPFDPALIAESVASAWYTYSGGATTLTPDQGETTVGYTGPQLPYNWLSDADKYTWSKAPRYDGRPVQVGPLARIMVGYAGGHARTRQLVDDAAKKLGITPAQLNSTGGRTLARAVDALIAAEVLSDKIFPQFVTGLKKGDVDVFDATKWDPGTWPKSAAGYSLVEVARGTLGHWVRIENGAISLYQAIVPSTWNAGGRDEAGQMGPYESALAGNGRHPLANSAEPLEPLRTIHSFDPCISCAVHVLDAQGHELQVVTTS
ncbi:MAG: nickel-dependent hydrogenase large subunit [Propionibacteriaceae bacterium]|jgi:hydrogenase large subunit|nr:nickel-dependent hydrogenase large subunit [Propionibacteriaceae bacterium]